MPLRAVSRAVSNDNNHDNVASVPSERTHLHQQQNELQQSDRLPAREDRRKRRRTCIVSGFVSACCDANMCALFHTPVVANEELTVLFAGL